MTSTEGRTMITSTSQSRSGLRVLAGGLAILVIVAVVATLVRAGAAGTPGETGARTDNVGPARPAVGIPATNAPAAAAGALQIVAVTDPEVAASDALIRTYHLTCANASEVLVQENPKALAALDAKAAARGVASGWIDPDRVFSGDALDAAKAFRAVEAFGDDTAVWIVRGPDKPEAVQLRSARTPGGKIAWWETNWITPC